MGPPLARRTLLRVSNSVFENDRRISNCEAAVSVISNIVRNPAQVLVWRLNQGTLRDPSLRSG